MESLKVSTRCGFRAKARQMRTTAAWLRPVALASGRALQRVASGGAASGAVVTARSTRASVIVRGAPGRGSSGRPPNPRSAKRRRRGATVGRLTRSACATAPLVPPPSAQASGTIRARRARPCAASRRRAHPSGAARSAAVKLIDAACGLGIAASGKDGSPGPQLAPTPAGLTSDHQLRPLARSGTCRLDKHMGVPHDLPKSRPRCVPGVSQRPAGNLLGTRRS